jgi:hypothetical protein
LKTYSEEELKEQYEDEIEPVNCPHCLERGYKVRLGGRILEPNEPRPADYENWLQCPTCYEVIPIHEIPKEEEIKDAVETIESPFEQGKFILESIPKRSSPKGKKLLEKKRINKIKLNDDKEINDLLRIYGDRIKVVHDTNP